MVSGTYVLTDSIDKAFDSIFIDSLRRPDAVDHRQVRRSALEGESAQAPPVLDESLLEQVRAVSTGVGAADGQRRRRGAADRRRTARRSSTAARRTSASRSPTAIDRSTRSTSSRAAGPAAAPRWRSTRRPPTRRTSQLGDRIGVSGAGPVEEFTIVGHRQVRRSRARSAAPRSRSSTCRRRSSSSTRRASSTSLGRRGGGHDARAADAANPDRAAGRLRRCGLASSRRTRSVRANRQFITIIRYFLLSSRASRSSSALRHLQLALDHGRAADAGVRDPADARRSRRQVLGSVILEALVSASARRSSASSAASGSPSG